MCMMELHEVLNLLKETTARQRSGIKFILVRSLRSEFAAISSLCDLTCNSHATKHACSMLVRKRIDMHVHASIQLTTSSLLPFNVQVVPMSST